MEENGMPMYKIRKLKFPKHPILGNLELDFTDSSGNAADTVIFAGENGTGKSAILRELYALASGTIGNSGKRYDYRYATDFHGRRPERWTTLPSGLVEPAICLQVQFEYYPNRNQTEKYLLRLDFSSDNSIEKVEPQLDGEAFEEMRQEQWHQGLSASLNGGGPPDYSLPPRYSLTDYPLTGLFVSKDVALKTARVEKASDERDWDIWDSGGNFKKDAEKLLIHLQSKDDADIVFLTTKNPNKSLESLHFIPRLDRFQRAFDIMFHDSGLRYCRTLKGELGNKEDVFFERGERIFPIQNLSSGEQEIVYRICFFLECLQSPYGEESLTRPQNPIVLLDEPETSLHPRWQERILECYRNLFSDDMGRQTSQIFAATHSPFLIHNRNPVGSKVIVLRRDEFGNISQGKAEYPACGPAQAIQEAFHVEPPQTPTVYLEGVLDEQYFNKALEVYGFALPFQFKRIGHADKSGKDEFSGKNNMDHAEKFLIGHATCTAVLLYDCDVNKREEDNGMVHIRQMKARYDRKTNPHPWGIYCGIENALVLDDCHLTRDDYYERKTSANEKGECTTREELRKRELCDDLCGMDNETLKKAFVHLKEEIESLIPVFDSHSSASRDS